MTMPSEPEVITHFIGDKNDCRKYIDALRAHAEAETKRADELAAEVERLREMTPVANVTLSGDAEYWKQRAEQAEAAPATNSASISSSLVDAPAQGQAMAQVDPMENWLMKPALEWLEQAEHGGEQQRCKVIAEILRDLWRRQADTHPPALSDERIREIARLHFGMSQNMTERCADAIRQALREVGR